jgi:hypothetical protein
MGLLTVTIKTLQESLASVQRDKQLLEDRSREFESKLSAWAEMQRENDKVCVL